MTSQLEDDAWEELGLQCQSHLLDEVFSVVTVGENQRKFGTRPQ